MTYIFDIASTLYPIGSQLAMHELRRVGCLTMGTFSTEFRPLLAIFGEESTFSRPVCVPRLAVGVGFSPVFRGGLYRQTATGSD